MSGTMPGDDEVRERAVTTVDRNVVVLAGAGSGKTSLLVERVLHLCIVHDVPLPGIAAITFTEAAAAEMRERLGGAFADLAGKEEPGASNPGGREADRARRRAEEASVAESEVRVRAGRALGDLPAATITTIHAFALALLRRHPFEAGLAPRSEVREPAEIARHLAGSWPDVLADLAADRGSPLREVLPVLALGDLQTFFVALGAAAAPVPEAWPDVHGTARQRLARSWPRIEERIDVRGAAPAVAGADAADVARLRRAVERTLREGAADSAEVELLDASLRGRRGGRASGADGDRERVVALLRALVPGADAPFAAALELLRQPAARARAAMARRGWVSFDGLLWRARDLLRDHPQIRREEAARFQAVLVDEFQDTDPLQYEIVFKLVEREGAGDTPDPWQAPLSPGRLFVVGDPKQSIFRFRGADIEACARAIERLEAEGALVLTLARSHRSPPAILGALDVLFRGWLPPASADEEERHAAPPYVPVVASRDASDPRYGPEPRVAVWTVPDAEDAAARRALEASFIANDVVASHRGGIPLGDHAILLRSFTEVSVYTRALTERQVPFVVDGGRTFYVRPEVRELLTLLRAVVEPNDAVALLSVLRSGVGAVPDGELLAHALSCGQARRPWAADVDADPAEAPALAAALAWLRALRERVLRQPVDEALATILRTSRLAICHGAAPDGAQRVANLGRLVARASQLHRHTGMSLAELAIDMAARGGPDGDEEGEPSLGDAGNDAVLVLTIHRAKGREFPVVYVPDLARGAPEPPRGAGLELPQSDARPGVAMRSRSGAATAAAHLARETQLVHEPAELRRLLYVATTRATERLVLLASPGNTPWLRALSAWGYDATAPPPDGVLLAAGAVTHRVLAGRPPLDALAPPRAPELLAAVERYRGLTSAVSPRPALSSPTAMAARGRPETGPSGVVRQHAFAVGTLVHEVLEGSVLGRADTLLSGDGLREAAEHLSARYPGTDGGAIAEAAAAILDRFVASPLWERLRAVGVVARELPLLASRDPSAGEAEAVAGYADVVFEEGGGLVVADWKTDPVADDDAMAALAERYRPQVAWYAHALARATGRPVRAELLFVSAGRACELGTFGVAVASSTET